MKRLTPRQYQVVEVLAMGGTSSDAAKKLGMSKHTARTHAQHAMLRLNIHSRADLTRWWMENKEGYADVG